MGGGGDWWVMKDGRSFFMVVSIQEDANRYSAQRRIVAEEIRQCNGIEDGIVDVDQDRNILQLIKTEIYYITIETRMCLKLYSFTPKTTESHDYLEGHSIKRVSEQIHSVLLY